MKSKEECPLGRFKLNGKGLDYYLDKFCLECLFVGDSQMCLCPEGLTLERYRELKEEYVSSVSPNNALTDEGFLRYLRKNYSSKTN